MENKPRNSLLLTTWFWFAAASVIIGAVLLYPIGRPVWNVLFIITKCGMLAGIILTGIWKNGRSFLLWAVFSAVAVIMTIIKWNLHGSYEGVFGLAVAADICIPAVAWILMKKEVRR
jgi:hypothetical protein